VDAAWVVCASFDGNVYALDRNTGVRKWTFPTGDEPSSPVIVRDKVLVSSNGALHMLRLAGGEEVWSNTVSDTITSPAIINGMAVVGSDDGTVTAFGPPQQ
jgi:outer membrane protein assembly factor BamB